MEKICILYKFETNTEKKIYIYFFFFCIKKDQIITKIDTFFFLIFESFI